MAGYTGQTQLQAAWALGYRWFFPDPWPAVVMHLLWNGLCGWCREAFIMRLRGYVRVRLPGALVGQVGLLCVGWP
jgi:hypothetical protein